MLLLSLSVAILMSHSPLKSTVSLYTFIVYMATRGEGEGGMQQGKGKGRGKEKGEGDGVEECRGLTGKGEREEEAQRKRGEGRSGIEERRRWSLRIKRRDRWGLKTGEDESVEGRLGSRWRGRRGRERRRQREGER